jgi:hypothetical protein
MTDGDWKERTMKQAALIVGIAAALAVPSVASAANSVQVKPELEVQVKPQRYTTQISRVQVHKVQRVTVARVAVQRATAYRIAIRTVR